MWIIVLLLIIFGGPILLGKILNHVQNVNKANNRKIKFSDWSTWYFLNEEVWQTHYCYDGIVSRKELSAWYCFNFIDEFRFKHFIKTMEKNNT